MKDSREKPGNPWSCPPAFEGGAFPGKACLKAGGWSFSSTKRENLHRAQFSLSIGETDATGGGSRTLPQHNHEATIGTWSTWSRPTSWGLKRCRSAVVCKPFRISEGKRR